MVQNGFKPRIQFEHSVLLQSKHTKYKNRSCSVKRKEDVLILYILSCRCFNITMRDLPIYTQQF